ncbi:MAG TPA: polyprenyl synthetase family protein [Chloroflexi bacterium]|nr:polyprenyl synthetase family protein [Chloroflexota bacterium]
MIKTAEINELVASDIKQVEEKMREVVGEHNETLTLAIDHLVNAGGKRLRPIITLLSTRFNKADHQKAIALAAAVEMLHTATLVHDDLIDNALFRRGHPTLNANWTPNATVLTGDYMFARSSGFAAETDDVRIIKIFSNTLMTIVNGELHQFFNNGHSAPPSQEEYFQRIYAKTASLFAAGAETGAILAALPETQVRALHDYGYYLGMAFQIMDDILDFQGDEARLGKPVANDLRQGIATLPVLLFLEDSPDHPLVLKAVAKQYPTDAEIEQVVAEIRASGGIQESLDKARRLARQAQEALTPLPDNKYRRALLDIADYSAARDI